MTTSIIPLCPHCGQRFRAGSSGLKWHLEHMHPAIAAALVDVASDEYRTITDKRERYHYERAIAGAAIHPCGHCGRPTSADYCERCTKSDLGHRNKPRSSDPVIDERNRAMMAAIRPGRRG